MFIAKFNQVKSNKFKEDTRGNLPFIGQVLAGKATGTVINGTIFQLDELVPNKVYLCDNVLEDFENVFYSRTVIISEISLLELSPLMAQLGEPNLQILKSESPLNATV